MPSDKKILAVMVGTGHQGFSLIRAILDEGFYSEFRPRAITNDINSEACQWLLKNGVEVRHVDINDSADLHEACKGCYGMYAVSLHWQHMSPEEETNEVKFMADAARRSGMQHVVWSTLEDTREDLKTAPTLLGNYKAPPFDVKADADHFWAESGVPTTYFITPFYWENFIDMGMEPKKTMDGTYEIALPMGTSLLAGMSSEDIGHCALTIFKHPLQYVNKRVGIMSEALLVSEIAEKMSAALGKTVRYRDIPLDEYRQLPIPGVKELANVFQYYRDAEEKVLSIRSGTMARRLYPKIMTFDQWLGEHRNKIPIRG